MKTNRFLALMAIVASVLFAASCEKEKPQQEQPDKPVGKNECKLLTIALKSGDIRVEGFVYEEEKIAEITCLPAQKEAFAKAIAEVTISEKATISPDPKEERDYTVAEGVKFKVTAADGKTSKEYKVLLKDAKTNVVCKKVWEKTYGDLDIKPTVAGIGNVAFSGDKIVTSNMEVIDLEGKKIGTLNIEGIVDGNAEGFRFFTMTNDHKNHLVASVGYENGGEKFTTVSDNIKYTRFYIWSDGWDKAPALLYENKEFNLTMYASAAGDLPQKGILTVIAGRSAVNQMHHCDVFENGKLQWNGFNTKYSGTDGNWGAIVSACSGDKEGYYFLADSRSNNKGMAVFVRHGIKGEDLAINGSLKDDGTVDPEHCGENQYGNYSSGHVRGFMLNGKPYAAVTTSGWPSAYLTIQGVNPEDENHFLLRTQVWAAAAPNPCAAVYTVSDGEVYVVMSAPSSAPVMAMFKITTEII